MKRSPDGNRWPESGFEFIEVGEKGPDHAFVSFLLAAEAGAIGAVVHARGDERR